VRRATFAVESSNRKPQQPPLLQRERTDNKNHFNATRRFRLSLSLLIVHENYPLYCSRSEHIIHLETHPAKQFGNLAPNKKNTEFLLFICDGIFSSRDINANLMLIYSHKSWFYCDRWFHAEICI
jgi:hypothetical protein